MDFTQRLDKLTKQLDSLTGVGNVTMQGTAELFLFVAIGLLLLLAIDTLLRFAVHMVSATGKRRLKGGSNSGSGRLPQAPQAPPPCQLRQQGVSFANDVRS